VTRNFLIINEKERTIVFLTKEKAMWPIVSLEPQQKLRRNTGYVTSQMETRKLDFRVQINNKSTPP
jgi:hypothetical protein